MTLTLPISINLQSESRVCNKYVYKKRQVANFPDVDKFLTISTSFPTSRCNTRYSEKRNADNVSGMEYGDRRGSGESILTGKPHVSFQPPLPNEVTWMLKLVAAAST